MKHLLTSILLLLALLLSATASAHNFEVDGIYYYNFNDYEVSVTYKNNWSSAVYTGDITIPSDVTYNGRTYSVTSIGDYAFYGCSGLTSIEIPNSVTTISYFAFYGCSGLTSIIIPNSVTTIDYNAFEECSALTSITIPNSVTTIGSRAFNGTAWYNNQPDGVVYAGLVTYKYKGTMPEGTTITLREGISSITASAFSGCSGLTSINIPNSITSIGTEAFKDCNGLTSINIPCSITYLGQSVFENCSKLETLNYNAVSAYDFSLGDPGGNIFARYHPFYNTSISTINIGSNVQKIPGNFAYGLTKLTSIDIPNSVTNICDDAFYGCTGLTSIDIPNSVTNIGGGAFDYTAWFNNQPDGLVYAGLVAYKYKGSFPTGTSIFLLDGTLGIAGSAFFRCTGLTSIDIPNSVTNIGGSAFFGCTGLTSIDIPNSVTNIGSYAFYECTGLTSIVIPNSVTTISYFAFSRCSGLTDVYSYITDLSKVATDSYIFSLYPADYSSRTLHVPHGTSATYQADNNWSQYFGSIVEMDYTFEVDGIYYSIINNNEIKVINSPNHNYSGSITIPATITYNNTTYSVTAIGNQAFANCTGLNSITIPSSVTSIGKQAFMNDAAIETVICKATTPPAWDGLDMFTTNVYNHAPLLVPKEYTRAYMFDQCWGQFVKIVSPGDVSMDGNLNISDVTILISMVLNNATTSPAADVNEDGSINITDVTTLINMVLNSH